MRDSRAINRPEVIFQQELAKLQQAQQESVVQPDATEIKEVFNQQLAQSASSNITIMDQKIIASQIQNQMPIQSQENEIKRNIYLH